MELDKFIEAIGTPAEWETVSSETVTIELTTGVHTRKVIGSVATTAEIDEALDSLR